MDPLKKYPLPAQEKNELIKVAVVSEAIMLVIAIALLIVTIGISTGDWGYAATKGWAQSIGFAFGEANSVAHVAPQPLESTSIFGSSEGFSPLAPTFSTSALFASIALGLLVGALLLGSLIAFDYVGRKRSANYRKSIMEVRQGVTGELVRLPMPIVVPTMILTGICEELAFRYAFMNGAILLLTLFIPPLPAAVIALGGTTLAFWLAHEQYRDPYSSSIVICAGLILGAAYLLTGWILVGMVAHAVYNIGEIALEQLHIAKEPDYYGGKVPNTLLSDAMKQARKDRERDFENEE